MAMIAAASITQDNGFHMNPKNFKNLLSWNTPKRTKFETKKHKQISKTKEQ